MTARCSPRRLTVLHAVRDRQVRPSSPCARRSWRQPISRQAPAGKVEAGSSRGQALDAQRAPRPLDVLTKRERCAPTTVGRSRARPPGSVNMRHMRIDLIFCMAASLVGALDVDELIWAARFAESAYSSSQQQFMESLDQDIDAQLLAKRLERPSSNLPQWFLAAATRPDQTRCIVLVLRGTYSLADALRDIDISLADYDHGKIHSGFWDGVISDAHLENKVVEHASNFECSYAIGHSLGGALALATIAAD